MNINHNNILIYDLYSLYSSLFFDIICINEYSIFYIQQSHLPYLILYIVHDIIYHIYHSYFMNINHQIRLIYDLYVSYSSLIFDIICIIITPYSRQHYHSNLANIRMVVYIMTCIIFCVMDKNPKNILIYDLYVSHHYLIFDAILSLFIFNILYTTFIPTYLLLYIEYHIPNPGRSIYIWSIPGR
jgi:hypothetical protein